MNHKRFSVLGLLALLLLALGFAGTANAQTPDVEWDEWSEWTPVVEQWRDHNTPATLLEVQLEKASYVEVEFEQKQVHDSNDNCAPQFNEEARVSFADQADYFLDGIAEDNRIQRLTFNSYLEAGSYPAVSEWAGDWTTETGCKGNGSYEIRARMRTGQEVPPRGEVEWGVGIFCSTDGFVGGGAFARNTSETFYVDWSVQYLGWEIASGRLMPGEFYQSPDVSSGLSTIQAGVATIVLRWENGDVQSFEQSFEALDCKLPPPPVDYSLTFLTPDVDCDAWSVQAVATPEGATVSYDPAQSGEWLEDQESVIVTATATWPNGETRTAEILIERPTDCEEHKMCKGTVKINFDFTGVGARPGYITISGQGMNNPVPRWDITPEMVGWLDLPWREFSLRDREATYVEAVHHAPDGTQTKLVPLNWAPDEDQPGVFGWVACNMPHSFEGGWPDVVAQQAANPTAETNPHVTTTAGVLGWQVGEVVEAVETDMAETITVAPTEHVVVPNDTVAGIAAQYGLTMFDVLSWNSLEYTPGTPVIIVPGQVLNLIPVG